MNNVELKDVPVSAFRKVLQFAYTGSLDMENVPFQVDPSLVPRPLSSLNARGEGVWMMDRVSGGSLEFQKILITIQPCGRLYVTVSKC